jgi:hypothetical protein
MAARTARKPALGSSLADWDAFVGEADRFMATLEKSQG